MDEKFVSMNEIIEMIDRKYGYAQDPEIKRFLMDNSSPEAYMHLVGSKNIDRYLGYYAKAHGMDELKFRDHIRKGATKSVKYILREIQEIISDDDIDRRIKELLKKKTLPGPNGLIPKCIYPQYLENFTGEEANKILDLTGYTKQQIELFAVPDDDLIQKKYDNDLIISEIKKNIENMQKKLDELQCEQDYIINELNLRGCDYFE